MHMCTLENFGQSALLCFIHLHHTTRNLRNCAIGRSAIAQGGMYLCKINHRRKPLGTTTLSEPF